VGSETVVRSETSSKQINSNPSLEGMQTKQTRGNKESDMSRYFTLKESAKSKKEVMEWDIKPTREVMAQPYLLQLLRNSYIMKHTPTDNAQTTVNRTPTFTLLLPNSSRYKSQRFPSMEAADRFLDALCVTNLVR